MVVADPDPRSDPMIVADAIRAGSSDDGQRQDDSDDDHSECT